MDGETKQIAVRLLGIAVIFALLLGLLAILPHPRAATLPNARTPEPPAAVASTWQGNDDSRAATKAVPEPTVRRVLPVESAKHATVAFLPDRSLTPGEALEGVTVNDLRVSGYSRKVRHVPEAERRAVLAEYHVAWADRYTVETDHLVPVSWRDQTRFATSGPSRTT
jgi:hypothetical protein